MFALQGFDNSQSITLGYGPSCGAPACYADPATITPFASAGLDGGAATTGQFVTITAAGTAPALATGDLFVLLRSGDYAFWTNVGVVDLPEPVSVLILGPGLMALARARRRRV